MKNFFNLQIEQLDRKLLKLKKSFNDIYGLDWINQIRNTLSMSTYQLANRIGSSQQNIVTLEKSEREGTITLNSLSKLAEALDCELVYALVPKTSLKNTIKEQAEKIAKERILRTSHSMKLEKQGLSEKRIQKQIKQLRDELIEDIPRGFWD